MEDWTEERLRRLIAGIRPADGQAMLLARRRQDQLAKPPGSLGKLESIGIRLAGVTGQVHNTVEKRRLLVLAADNGVCAEGVSATPQSVTLAQTINLTRGLTGAAALARHFGDEVVVADVGVMTDVPCPDVLPRKVAYGTRDFCREPAMTRQQAVQAILTGADLAAQAADEGVRLLGVGEMGIGNTTTSSAVLAALTGANEAQVTGRGAGALEPMFLRKKQVICQGLDSLRPDPADPVDVLSKVGGFDLCAMCGSFLGAAARRLPVVVDGFISVVAALCAARLCPAAKDAFFPSHASYEIGYRLAAEELGLEPFLLLDMRLGEGSGCPLAFLVIEAACAVLNEMATFEEARIDDGYLADIRKNDAFTVTGAGR